MKKLVISLTLAIVVTVLGASTVFADGADTVLKRLEKQKKQSASIVAKTDVKVKSDVSLKVGSPAWILGLR